MQLPAPPCSRRRLLRGGLALAGLGVLAGCGIAAPSADRLKSAPAPVRIPRIGVLVWATVSGVARMNGMASLRQSLRELGYRDGQVAFEMRTAQTADLYPARAAELAGSDLDLIVADSTLAVLAAVGAAPALPVVMVEAGDPVATGLVSSLPRPGGNVTGLTTVSSGLSAKRLQLFKDAVPQLSRVAVLRNPDDPDTGLDFAETARAAGALGLDLQPLEVRRPADFDAALAAARDGRAQGLIILSDGLVQAERARVAGFAFARGLPTMFDRKDFVVSATRGLMAYGPDIFDNWRRAARFVDKILRGASPADLPVEQPAKFEFAINLATAGALGLTIPPTVLQQASEIIE